MTSGPEKSDSDCFEYYTSPLGWTCGRFPALCSLQGIVHTVTTRKAPLLLALVDDPEHVELAMLHESGEGELRILNQFTEVFTVNTLAEKVKVAGQRIGLDVQIQELDNPRKELEEHYYNPAYTALKELGLKPHLLTDDVLTDMLLKVGSFKERINRDMIMPRVNWK